MADPNQALSEQSYNEERGYVTPPQPVASVEKLAQDLEQEKVTCPLCGQSVPIKDHPSPAWRSMLPHDHDGERCVGTGRGLAEAREFTGGCCS